MFDLISGGPRHPFHEHTVAPTLVSIAGHAVVVMGVIGRRLNLPVVSKAPEEAPSHFTWLSPFVGADCPASSAQTQERLQWQATKSSLIADIDRTSYFEA